MRRVVGIIVTLVMVGGLAGSASARTLRVRHDPNDSSFNIDIRTVSSDLSNTKVYLRVDSWQRFRAWNMDGEWITWLDSTGSPDVDHFVEIWAYRGHIICSVDGPHNPRRASRPDERSAACNLPRSWFGHIDRAVRFDVVAEKIGAHMKDRAPQHGFYRWL